MIINHKDPSLTLHHQFATLGLPNNILNNMRLVVLTTLTCFTTASVLAPTAKAPT